MKAELRRALTTRHRGPPPRAQSRSGEGSACLRPLQSPPAGPKDARWNEAAYPYPNFFCQVFSAMRAELRRALTTATAPCTITLGRR